MNLVAVEVLHETFESVNEVDSRLAEIPRRTSFSIVRREGVCTALFVTRLVFNRGDFDKRGAGKHTLIASTGVRQSPDVTKPPQLLSSTQVPKVSW